MICIEFNFDFTSSIYNKRCFNKGVKILKDIANAYQVDLQLKYVVSNDVTMVKHTIDLDESAFNSIISIINEMFVLKKSAKQSDIQIKVKFIKIKLS